MYRRILVPLDGSRRAELALAHAASLADRYAGELTLLRILTPLSRLVERGPARVTEHGVVVEPRAVLHADRHRSDAYLDRAARRLRNGERRIGYTTAEGDPAAEITRYAAAIRADVIVMTSRGLGGWRRLMLGSVAESVLRSAPCPVLVVRGSPEPADRIDLETPTPEPPAGLDVSGMAGRAPHHPLLRAAPPGHPARLGAAGRARDRATDSLGEGGRLATRGVGRSWAH